MNPVSELFAITKMLKVYRDQLDARYELAPRKPPPRFLLILAITELERLRERVKSDRKRDKKIRLGVA